MRTVLCPEDTGSSLLQSLPLTISLPLFCDVPWALRAGSMAQISKVIYSLHLELLCVSVLTTIHCKEFFWWGLREVLIYEYKGKHLETIRYDILSVTTVVDFLQGPMISLGFLTKITVSGHELCPMEWALKWLITPSPHSMLSWYYCTNMHILPLIRLALQIRLLMIFLLSTCIAPSDIITASW